MQMELGFYMSCFMDRPLEAIARWARENGFTALELYAGPKYRFIDWPRVAAGETRPVLEPLERHGLKIAGMMYGQLRFLSADPATRRDAAEYLQMMIRAARNLGVPVVSTFTGRDPLRFPREQIGEAAAIFRPLAAEAEKAGVKLAFENCPMAHEWPPVHNLAVTPALWAELLRQIDSPAVGLNIDPSHLVWQGIDYIEAVRAFKDRIWLAQAKDTEVMVNIQRTHGMFDPQWWRHRIPGQGDVDWQRFVSVLHEVGYNGVLSIEHEDPIWSGTPERVERGLQLAAAHLRQFM